MECKCYRFWYSHDDSTVIKDNCPIHGPKGTLALQLEHARAQHSQERHRIWEKREELAEAIREGMAETRMFRPDQRVVGELIVAGVMACLQHLSDKNGGRMYPHPEDTSWKSEYESLLKQAELEEGRDGGSKT